MNEKFSVITPEKLSEIILTSRLDAISEAQKRARVAFFLSTLATGIILAALWNLYLSWDRQWADLAYRPESWGREQLIMQQIKSWMESQLVGVPLLGLRLSVSDAAFLGSIVLLIFSFYYCMCMRRENHEIGSLLVDVTNNNESYEIKHLVFLRIRSFMVFSSTTDNDAPFRSLSGQNLPARPIRFSRAGFRFFIYLPALTVFLIVVSDMYYSFFYESPFVRNMGTVWESLPTPFRRQLILTDIFALILGSIIFYFCWRADGFHKGTRQITEELKVMLDTTGAANHSSAMNAQTDERQRDTESGLDIRKGSDIKRDERNQRAKEEQEE